MPGAFLGTEIKKINMTWVSCMDGHLYQGHEIQEVSLDTAFESNQENSFLWKAL